MVEKLKKKYKQTNFGTQGDKAWSDYKARFKADIDAKRSKLDSKVNVNRGKVDTNISNYKGDVAPNYNKITKVDKEPEVYTPDTTETEVSTAYEGPSASSTSYPNYEPKPVTTGNLSSKSEPASSDDRMSWAREAERKARKLMGGN